MENTVCVATALDDVVTQKDSAKLRSIYVTLFFVHVIIWCQSAKSNFWVRLAG